MAQQQGNKVPLLDLIRNREAEVTRLLAAAHESAEQEIAAAQQRVGERLAAAEDEGRREGESQREARLREVDEEVQQILVKAQAEAEKLRQLSPTQMEAAVSYAVNVIIGRASAALHLPYEEGLTHEA